MIWDILLALLLMLVGYEAGAWFPRLVDVLVRLAARRLPPKHRARYLEEWRALVQETPGAVKKLYYAFDLRRGAAKMYPSFTARLHVVRSRRRALLRIALLDRAIASFVLVTLSPLLILLVISTRVAGGPGPILFRKRRFLPDGRMVFLVQFRTMRIASDGTPPEENVTRIGQILRRTNWDDLPNLFSVLSGNVSLIDMCIHDERMGIFRRSPSISLYLKVIFRTTIIALRGRY